MSPCVSGSSIRRDYPALTTIRGIAAWWVVLYHFRVELGLQTWPIFQAVIAFGYLAVDLFFIMSGFVIALSYEQNFRSLRQQSILRFLGYRLARIYPLHLVVMILFLANPIAIALFSSEGTVGDRYDIGYYFESLFLIQNWGFSDIAGWNYPAWSISTEWAAYLIFPIMAWCSVRMLTNLRNIAAVILVVGTALMVFSARAGGLGNDIPRIGLARCLLEFSIGICLLKFWAVYRLGPSVANVVSIAAIAILVIGAAMGVPDYVYAPWGLALLIVSLLCDTAILSRLLNNPVLIGIGKVSYSTYMIHYLVKDWVKFTIEKPSVPSIVPFFIYVLCVAAASVVLYRFVELPGRIVGRKLTDRILHHRQAA